MGVCDADDLFFVSLSDVIVSITLHFRGHRVLRVVGAALRRDCHDKGPALRGHCDDERVSVFAEDRQGGVGLVFILSLGQFT